MTILYTKQQLPDVDAVVSQSDTGLVV